MRVNLGWLRNYVDIPYDPAELAAKLTAVGLEATPIYPLHPALKEVKIAHLLKVERHPQADRLTLCTVTTGEDTLTVVCGAPNVAVGQKVPLALSGTTLPNGMVLKKATIRGVPSEGMLCAEDELGLSADHSGVMVLPPAAPLGISLWDYLEQTGQCFEIELTPNRPDCAAHIGIAREIAVLSDTELKIPAIKLIENSEPTADYIQVTLADPIGCPRYAARLVKNVKVGPSPEWLVNYLRSVGLRSINNVVDAANFVLMETGHPLHTFDYAQILGKQIIVRRALPDEVVVTLDGFERRLTPEILLICDAQRPVAIAGIMGLANSEISTTTQNVLIESAYFQPQTIRKGSKLLGLQTDASYRFERGTDVEGVIYAINRLAELIVQVAGGEICQGIVDAYPHPHQPPTVRVRFKRIDSLIGNHYEPDWVVKLFHRLGCQIVGQDPEAVTVSSPTWRPDLEREADYIEEVLRIGGMDAVPLQARLPVHPMVSVNTQFEMIEKLRSLVVACGFTEHYSNSLVSLEETQLTLDPVSAIQLQNPLSQDMAFLRTTIIAGLLSAAKRNINRRQTNLQLFELGYVQAFEPKSETTSREALHLGVIVTGLWEEKHWAFPARPADYFILKGLLEEITHHFGLTQIEYKPTKLAKYQHLTLVKYRNETLAWLGQIDPRYLIKNWDIEQPIWVMELDGELLLKNADFKVRYKPLPVFPTVERDLSIIVSQQIPVAEVTRLIEEQGGEILHSVRFYDLYTGKNIDNDQKSLTFRLVFQASERTLQDVEVDQVMQKIYIKLNQTIGARYR
jgi:phenylalanyl-tRNA synthetase beta chain